MLDKIHKIHYTICMKNTVLIASILLITGCGTALPTDKSTEDITINIADKAYKYSIDKAKGWIIDTPNSSNNELLRYKKDDNTLAVYTSNGDYNTLFDALNSDNTATKDGDIYSVDVDNKRLYAYAEALEDTDKSLIISCLEGLDDSDCKEMITQ